MYLRNVLALDGKQSLFATSVSHARERASSVERRSRETRETRAEELGTMSKNNLRRITLEDLYGGFTLLP